MKRIIKRLFPGGVAVARNLLGRMTVADVEQRVFRACQGCVLQGPFRGMRYLPQASGSALAPKLLGTYEQELHPWLDEIIRQGYAHVLDVGAAEGYYAVGLALRLPASRVEAFDTDAAARDKLAALADANGVTGRLRIAGACAAGDIQAHAGQRGLLICDIEGAERDLLDPVVAPALADYDLLVEIHDGRQSTAIHTLLSERFRATHDLAFVQQRERNLRDAACVRGIWRARSRLVAVCEWRTFGIEWGLFRARKWLA